MKKLRLKSLCLVLSLRRSREGVHHVKRFAMIDRKFEFSLNESNLGMPKGPEDITENRNDMGSCNFFECNLKGSMIHLKMEWFHPQHLKCQGVSCKTCIGGEVIFFHLFLVGLKVRVRVRLG